MLGDHALSSWLDEHTCGARLIRFVDRAFPGTRGSLHKHLDCVCPLLSMVARSTNTLQAAGTTWNRRAPQRSHHHEEHALVHGLVWRRPRDELKPNPSDLTMTVGKQFVSSHSARRRELAKPLPRVVHREKNEEQTNKFGEAPCHNFPCDGRPGPYLCRNERALSNTISSTSSSPCS